MSHCEDCGCKVYSGACTNCHEAVYIEQQYHELGMSLNDCSDKFKNEIAEAHQDINRKLAIKASY